MLMLDMITPETTYPKNMGRKAYVLRKLRKAGMYIRKALEDKFAYSESSIRQRHKDDEAPNHLQD